MLLLLLLVVPVVFFFSFVFWGEFTANKLVKDKPIQKYYDELKENLEYYPLEKVSTNIKFVVLCLEDVCFFRHHGYNLKRIAYAFYHNLKYKNRIGGSTITQQLAKNMYFSFKKTYRRKIAEFFVARKLEKALTKEQIFDIYLNIIYYGADCYGIKAACEYYYGKKPSEVSLNQAITLGCVLPAPSVYNPFSENNLFDKARKVALQRMVYLKVMKREDADLYQTAAYAAEMNTSVSTAYEKSYAEFYCRFRDNKTKIGEKECG